MSLYPMKRGDQLSPLKVSYLDTDSQSNMIHYLNELLTDVPASNEIVIICIGTDRSTGDALGPFVGTFLKRYQISNIHLFGTIDQPVHAVNLQETLDRIEHSFDNPYVIAVDACLGRLSSVGFIQIGQGPVKPGLGVHKNLPPVGNAHITGIVNVGGFMEYFVLQNTRLSIVIEMAEMIAYSLCVSLKANRTMLTEA